MSDYNIFSLGDIVLQSGMRIPDAKVAYKTYGTLNAAKDNVIVYPTWYSGQHYENEWLIGEDKALDPTRYFIIVPNMFCNGLSSSPSNTPAPYGKARFPNVTAYDNVRMQWRLVTELFGIEKIALVTGWSMGALQTFHWGAMYPEMVERILPFQGSSKCSRHNFVFLEGVKAALTVDAAFSDGWYDAQPDKGLRAAARVYAGWGLSQTFYREKLDLEKLGYSSLEDFLVGFWEGWLLSKDANNLLGMLWTWQYGDISNNEMYQGDFVKALSSIRAKAIVMPCKTDLYFPPEDSEFEVRHMPNAELRVVDSIWGHFAGGPGTSPVDIEVLDKALRELLER
ncbi:alpha/beta fold hydrolase [Paraburkholderia fynbosensis]|uniref:Homoserine O-acetyltransferase n=1 Tax=Paraburkholderia fynbosensis TaxID=1200993 RepID=A0A6J5H7Y7_9BURK|nr:alpha/beta fold hydrolase [Paraburkholderia fynbosensis]CAB3810521.1 Homoserine O-acetyltransferase [Paraburkholderia fynbosensis]